MTTLVSIEPLLAEFLAAECERLNVPGASIGIVHHGEELYVCHGVTNVDDPQDVTPDTLFGIGSTSKTITATALMALVEQGFVSLDDLVVDHLPDVPIADPEVKKTVTVGQLVDHTAGWVGDATCQTGWGDDALERAIEEMLPAAPQFSAPGELMSYNNLSFTLAGHLIATLAGESFEEAARRLVLDPLGMTNTFYFPWEVAQRRSAVGHVASPAGIATELTWPTMRWLGPAGSVFSSARDQMTYARFHLDGSAAVAPINDETRRLMRDPRVTVGSSIDGVGVSWLLRSYGRLKLAEHGGNLSNLQVSAFFLVPDVNLGVTVLANSAGGSQLGPSIKAKIFELLLGVGVPEALVPIEQPDLNEYIGSYEAGQWDVLVEEKDGRLQFGMLLTDATEEISDELRAVFEGTRTQAFFCGPDVVAPVDAPTVSNADFIRDSSGRISHVRQGMRVARRRA